MKIQAIIVAGGGGTRLRTDLPKPLVMLCGKPLVAYSLEVLERSPDIAGIILAGQAERLTAFEDIVQRYCLSKTIRTVAGGDTRRASVANALRALDADTDVAMVHDAARPLVTLETISGTAALCREWEAVVAAVPVKPTIKRVGMKDLCVEATLDRSKLWEIQTPQVFRKDVLIRAHAQCADPNPSDDAVMVERLGVKVKIYQGDYSNIKVTTPEDLAVAEALLGARGPKPYGVHGR